MAPATDWKVVWHQEAVVELSEVRSARSRKAVLTEIRTLCRLGDRLAEPHCKKVRGSSKLFELRPGGGQVPVRPLYARIDERSFMVLAVGPEALIDPRGFSRAIERARSRARSDYGLTV